LDWFRFHGKKYVVNLLHESGFYDVRITRKMDFLESCSFIKIEAIYLSVVEGAVYGAIRIYADRIETYDGVASFEMERLIQDNARIHYLNHQTKKQKEPYLYVKQKI
jgi:hypothetical protein